MGRTSGGSNEISVTSTKQLIGALTHVKLPVTLAATESQVRGKNLSTLTFLVSLPPQNSNARQKNHVWPILKKSDANRNLLVENLMSAVQPVVIAEAKLELRTSQ